MKSTTITDLRTHLSRSLDAVRSGQTIEVRDRKVPIARIVPITAATGPAEGDLPPWVERLRRSGGARIGSLKKLPSHLLRLPPGPLDTGVVDSLLDESRIEITDVPAASRRARRLLEVHRLRAGDVLQVAAALNAVGDAPDQTEFVTMDERLAECVDREGFRVTGIDAG